MINSTVYMNGLSHLMTVIRAPSHNFRMEESRKSHDM